MTSHLKNREQSDTKTPFSHVVKKAVDELNIRDYYKGTDDLKIAKHTKELMRVLFTNHHLGQQSSTETPTISTGLVLVSDTEMLPQLQTEPGVQAFYMTLPKLLRSSPNISPHDRILCQTVFDLLFELKFNVYDDTHSDIDVLTQRLTTDRVPDRKELRHYIDKKELLGGKDMSRVGRHGSGHIEQLREHDIAQANGDFGLSPELRKKPLYRILENGTNKLSHTPFEYFHSYDQIKTNRGTVLYLLRVYTHTDPSTGKDASIITLVDSSYNFLNPAFPVIDDSESKQLIMTNFFGTYNVGYFAGGIFFRYKDELVLIKNGRYTLPGFADQVIDKKFHTLKIVTGGFALSYEESPHYLYTDNYMRVLGKDMDEVQKLLKKLKEK